MPCSWLSEFEFYTCNLSMSKCRKLHELEGRRSGDEVMKEVNCQNVPILHWHTMIILLISRAYGLQGEEDIYTTTMYNSKFRPGSRVLIILYLETSVAVACVTIFSSSLNFARYKVACPLLLGPWYGSSTLLSNPLLNLSSRTCYKTVKPKSPATSIYCSAYSAVSISINSLLVDG